jgi:ATP-dependent DNA helicase PIF1
VADSKTKDKDVIRWVFEDVVAAGARCVLQAPKAEDLAFLAKRAILAPKNDVVAEFNNMILQQYYQDTLTTYASSDTIHGATAEDYGNYPVEFLNSLELSGLPPHELHVAPGAVVILMRNVDTERGLCNGIRAVVVQCRRRVLDVILLTGKFVGSRYLLPRIPMSSESGALPFKLLRRQYPVRLAWSMSINKAQGQSLQRTPN